MRRTADWPYRSFWLREKLELGVEIVSAYGRARWWLWRTDLPRTVSVLREAAPSGWKEPADVARAGARLGRVVGRTLRHLPFDSRCLMRSLVLTSLLARRGIDSSLVIAVLPALSCTVKVCVCHAPSPVNVKLSVGDSTSPDSASLAV